MPKFRTKARAVDHLGKGQIADLPTAISELWKNGYDANANNLICNLYTENHPAISKPLFTLSDDGDGMSLDDILNKWLVLGTDDKITTNQSSRDDTSRKKLGEKGIGRLSVAYLGSEMLLISKKSGEKPSALFFDWNLFDNTNLFLEDVIVPIRELENSHEIKEDLTELIDEFKENLSELDWDNYEDLRTKIESDIDKTAQSEDLISQIISKFLGNNSHGTIFLICNPVEQLVELGREKSENPEDNEAINHIRASLSGLNNSFKNEKIVNTCFYVNYTGKREIIGNYDFFSKSDFQSVDHYFCGKFDEYGSFNGKVKIFGEEFDHSFTPNRKPGLTHYGPFNLEIGFVEGQFKNTSLLKEEWEKANKKLLEFGGIYIYRDKFRVLPYGRPSEDWLNFEERRSKGAGYYFFSHRRMFGYLEITKEENRGLCDKAGREGFIKNKAYRELKNDLIQFFIDLSTTYMRNVTKKEVLSGKPETARQKALSERKKSSLQDDKNQESEERKKYSKILAEAWKNLLEAETEILNLRKELEKILASNTSDFSELSDLDSAYREILSNFSQLAINSPTWITLTEDLKNESLEYESKYNYLHKILDDDYDRLLSLIDVSSKIEENDNYNNKIAKEIENIERKITECNQNFIERLDLAQRNLKTILNEDLNQIFLEYQHRIDHVKSRSNSEFSEYSSISKELLEIERNYDEIVHPKYESFISHLERLDISIDEDLVLGYYKEQYTRLEEKIDEINELAQLGIAVEIIDHQFKVLYAEMAASIKYFGKYGSSNPEDKENYNQMKNSFEHLETNYQLLTPLYRTMRRGKKNITGKEIKDYLEKFFYKSFNDNGIKFSIDESFESFVFKNTYYSVIIPVFINIINNAIYWLRPVDNREILLRVDDGMVLILNSGQRIKEGDLEHIFERFFSRKPGGRGIGLYLAKTNLKSLGYDIFATNDPVLNNFGGACFVINRPEEKNG